MALLYGGLVLLVGVSLLFTSIVLLDRSIAHVPFFNSAPITPTGGTGQQIIPSQIGRQARTSAVD